MAAVHMHIGFVFHGQPKTIHLVPVFDQALDWIRYSETNWIVWTTSSEQVWFERIRPNLGPNDSVLIVRIDPPNAAGWMPKRIWDWLNSSKPTEVVAPMLSMPWRQSKRG